MKELFGDEIDDDPPMNFLEKAGYKLTERWSWTPKPGVSTVDDMTEDEWECMIFLIQEWDMGGLELA